MRRRPARPTDCCSREFTFRSIVAYYCKCKKKSLTEVTATRCEKATTKPYPDSVVSKGCSFGFVVFDARASLNGKKLG
ncbi:hypothetical protein pipiens_008916 [Culex pipiens pipiens]|uniref:Uncharacterized protein n=1 Tax=Culex pipiens pipiens TaxID=38569 RepID=A0ABD1DFN5_CULPP